MEALYIYLLIGFLVWFFYFTKSENIKELVRIKKKYGYLRLIKGVTFGFILSVLFWQILIFESEFDK